MTKKKMESGGILLGLCGRKQVGKSYSARYIQNTVGKQYNKTSREWSLARKLKALTAEMFHVDIDKLDGTDEDKNSPTHLKWLNVSDILFQDFFGYTKDEMTFAQSRNITYRELLQLVGTNSLRGVWPAIWTEYLKRQLISSSSEVNIISDVRFPDEAEMVKNLNGYLVKIYRNTGSNQSANHASETSLDHLPDSHYDFVIKDDGNRTLEDLYQSWVKILGEIL